MSDSTTGQTTEDIENTNASFRRRINAIKENIHLLQEIFHETSGSDRVPSPEVLAYLLVAHRASVVFDSLAVVGHKIYSGKLTLENPAWLNYLEGVIRNKETALRGATLESNEFPFLVDFDRDPSLTTEYED